MLVQRTAWTQEEESRLHELLQWEYGREDLRTFRSRLLPHLKPQAHLEPLLSLWERTRREQVRAVIELPPRHAKTTTGLIGLSWRIACDPALKFAYGTYGDDLSLRGARAVRRLATAAGVNLMHDGGAAVHDWQTEFEGGLASTGVGGPLTGKGITGAALVDDPFKNRKEAESPNRRETVWEWFTDVVWTRLEDDASCIVMGTRWHVDDLIGRLLDRGDELEGGPRFERLRLPARAEIDDLLGRAVGAPLWPDKFGEAKLTEIEKLLGPYSWASLYQQSPRPRGHQIFGEPALFELKGWRIDGHRVCLCADPAATKSTTADWSAALVLAIKGYGADAEVWIVDHLRAQDEIPKVVKLLRAKQQYWGNVACVVEAVAGFKAVPQMLREIDPSLRVLGITPVGDKFQRAQALASAWNRGKVYVPSDAPWAGGLIKRFQAFTGLDDPEDDEIDAAAHGFNAMFMPTTPAPSVRRTRSPFG